MKLYPITVIFAATLFSATVVNAKLSIFNSVSNPSQIELSWPSQTGKYYQILESSDLTSADSFSIISSVQQGTSVLPNIWEANLPESGARFYKLAISDSINLTSNSDFTNDTSSWNLNDNNGASANFSVSDGELFVDITNGGTRPSHVLLNQTGIPLIQNQNYTLKFDARAASVRTLRVWVQYGEGNNNTNVANFNDLPLTTESQTYRLPFTFSAADVSNGKIKFFLGNKDTSVFLDNILDNNNSSVYLDNIRLLVGNPIELRSEAHRMNDRLHRGNSFMAAKAMNDQGALEDYQLLKTSGFSHCRIGYKMDEVAGIAPNYTLPPADLTKLQKMVDWCIQEGLIAVIDPVHNWANSKQFITTEANREDDFQKLGKIWEQVADHFSNHSLSDVVFEVFNEPHNTHDVARIISTSLASIRSSSGNEKRIVIVPGDGFTTRQALIDAFNNDEIPADDPYLIATFHYYEPKSFTKSFYENPPTNWSYNPAWGTTAELNLVATDFDEVVTANNNWATRNFTEPLPIYLGEFGVDNEADLTSNDRKKWLSWIRMQAEARNMSWAHWNMYQNEPSAKGMGAWTHGPSGTIQNPSLRAFDPDPVEALIGHYEFENGILVGVTLSNQFPGYKGSGYITFPETSGKSIFVRTEDLYIPADGTYALKIRYSSSESRTMRLISRNDADTTVQVVNILFPGTGSTDSWTTQYVHLNFEAGQSAKLLIVALPDPGVNLDWLDITLP
ncbi:MAG: cellulase family glycosylhydrolase [Verrucomicrobiota bacterium]|nr:cellulase family glycosylhydrolase [Verrucomicrobiota bacterium]